MYSIGSYRQMKGICVSCNEGNFSIDHVLFECKVFNEARFVMKEDNNC